MWSSFQNHFSYKDTKKSREGNKNPKFEELIYNFSKFWGYLNKVPKVIKVISNFLKYGALRAMMPKQLTLFSLNVMERSKFTGPNVDRMILPLSRKKPTKEPGQKHNTKLITAA